MCDTRLILKNDVPLSQPLYGATFTQAVGRFFTKYAVFSGRASRSEGWWVVLFFALLWTVGLIALAVVGGLTGNADHAAVVVNVALGLMLIVNLALLVPTFALLARRLHDTNQSGWLVLITLIPTVGGIAALAIIAQASRPEGARFDKTAPSAQP